MLSTILVPLQQTSRGLRRSAVLLAGVAAANLAWAAQGAVGQTMELKVAGLNCALCSEAMKSSLKKAAGATDIEPRLECGAIYLQVPPGTQPNEGALNFTLLANGFNFKSLGVSPKSIEEVRASKSC